MELRKGAICTLSDESGVEGVAGEGEREAEAACEEEDDMVDRWRGERRRKVGGRAGRWIEISYNQNWTLVTNRDGPLGSTILSDRRSLSYVPLYSLFTEQNTSLTPQAP